MDSTTAQLLKELSNKLGTTSEYLWSVLIKQAFLSGITDIIYYVIALVIAYITIRLHLKFSDNNREWSYYNKEEGLVIVMICLLVMNVILTLNFIFSFGDTMNAFFNPEYWALGKILDKVN